MNPIEINAETIETRGSKPLYDKPLKHTALYLPDHLKEYVKSTGIPLSKFARELIEAHMEQNAT